MPDDTHALRGTVVPNLDVGVKLVRACNEVGALDATQDVNSIDACRSSVVPKEFIDKLDFDAQGRSQFEGHLLARFASGGLAGFGQRLMRVYIAAVSIRLQHGYEGSIMGLWNQDMVYIIGELLCYTDDVMSARISIALEELFLTELAVAANAELFEKLVAGACPRLTAALSRDESFSACMFGLSRQFGGTLLAKGFGGCVVVPRLWRACIEAESLRPIVAFVVELMRLAEDQIVADVDAGRGLTGLTALLRKRYDAMQQVDLDDLVVECIDSANRPASPRPLYTGATESWSHLSASAASFLHYCYPIAYGLIPPWARQHGPEPFSWAPRVVITAVLWLLWFLVLHAVITPTAGKPSTEVASYAFPILIASVVVLIPLIPIPLFYGVGSQDDYSPLREVGPGRV